MTKIHPNGRATGGSLDLEKVHNKSPTNDHDEGGATVLTVWKKSLLLNCQGFTVYDSNGSIIFRVDNYLAGNKDQIVLMDASGGALLNIRRKKLSLADNWVVYDGDTSTNPRYSVTKHMNLLSNNKTLAHVTSITPNKNNKIHVGEDGSSSSPKKNKSPIFEIEGSYTRRCCSIYDSVGRKKVAEIKRKEAAKGMVLGVDVFSLVLQREQIDLAFAMSLVLVLDQMYGSSPST
ncbi:hypothetical protein LIER_07012 [Lithospermum erythrorhizon]|uniref:Protein LURP-one-related 8 n=1 Tax=Lithospermum erythrorhizon TaxID=34254 RepID=A0AAV3P7F6_LITER